MCSQPGITLSREQAEAVVESFFDVTADPVKVREAVNRLSRDLDAMPAVPAVSKTKRLRDAAIIVSLMTAVSPFFPLGLVFMIPLGLAAVVLWLFWLRAWTDER